VSREEDYFAFTPRRNVRESGVTYEVAQIDGEDVLRVLRGPGGAVDTYPLEGVIAAEPLRQYLAAFPGGRWQTTSIAYDPEEEEWFEVFEGEDRQPGEWGHWTGQGMNWNANCAYCHMTEYEKGYDAGANTYESSWTHQGIGCAECHSGLSEHVAASHGGDYAAGLETLSAEQIQHNCATCHSRRDQLTADAFEPGDDYHDHFGLSLPDQPGLYYADGQIRDEVFVYASFEMSRMGHAGVTCLDCHDPHTLDLKLPATNNALCMQCHETGQDEAPVIEPLVHSNHPAGSTGNSCVECHMPHTTYMQRDPRRDHGFHSPDPLMTRERGIPNACSTCHEEETLDWAVEWAERWYGEKLEASRQRARARALSDAYAGEADAHAGLLALAREEEIPAWRATYAGLLGNTAQADAEAVIAHLEASLKDGSPLVRARAVQSLGGTRLGPEAASAALNDRSRSVRIAASRVLSTQERAIPNMQALAEWGNYLAFNADRPQTALMLAEEAIRGGDVAGARRYVRNAVSFDARSPLVVRNAAVLMSIAGDIAEAERLLSEGMERLPADADLPYLLALLRAEQGNLAEAIRLLRVATERNPELYRAWYNLAIALVQLERWEEANAAIERAGPGLDHDPNWRRTRAIIQRNLPEAGPPGSEPPGTAGED